MDINRIVLKGNICTDIELKNEGTGKEYMNLRLATNQGVKKPDDTWDNVATFHNVTVFKKTAEYLAKEASKGDTLYVEGTLKYTEKDGKYYTNILANEAFLIKARQKKNNNASAQPSQSAPKPAMPQTRETLDDVKDDLPF